MITKLRTISSIFFIISIACSPLHALLIYPQKIIHKYVNGEKEPHRETSFQGNPDIIGDENSPLKDMLLNGKNNGVVESILAPLAKEYYHDQYDELIQQIKNNKCNLIGTIFSKMKVSLYELTSTFDPKDLRHNKHLYSLDSSYSDMVQREESDAIVSDQLYFYVFLDKNKKIVDPPTSTGDTTSNQNKTNDDDSDDGSRDNSGTQNNKKIMAAITLSLLVTLACYTLEKPRTFIKKILGIGNKKTPQTNSVCKITPIQPS